MKEIIEKILPLLDKDRGVSIKNKENIEFFSDGFLFRCSLSHRYNCWEVWVNGTIYIRTESDDFCDIDFLEIKDILFSELEKIKIYFADSDKATTITITSGAVYLNNSVYDLYDSSLGIIISLDTIDYPSSLTKFAYDMYHFHGIEGIENIEVRGNSLDDVAAKFQEATNNALREFNKAFEEHKKLKFKLLSE